MIRPSCGRQSGYVMHRRAGEEACPACLEAHARYNRLSRYKLASHGTLDGLKRHALTHSAVCDLCLDLACQREHDQRAYYFAALRAFPRHEIAS